MHVDAELLALLALGEPAGDEAELAHVRTCAECAAALAALQRVAGLARGAAGVTLVEPSPRVWEAVRSDLGAPVPAPRADEVTARARLSAGTSGWTDAWGDAEVSTDGHGRRVLQVTLHADLPPTGIRQAWLVHSDGRLQTLGILDGLLGLWTVPRTIDLDEFGVVDVSQQDLGSSGHSGDTIVRGRLVPVA